MICSWWALRIEAYLSTCLSDLRTERVLTSWGSDNRDLVFDLLVVLVLVGRTEDTPS